ncbi:MAG: hypothetical protein IT436_02495 [Phycisphaerales bacterium]|nr:hypothetical protein [Phycisphaerales bacterium]
MSVSLTVGRLFCFIHTRQVEVQLSDRSEEAAAAAWMSAGIDRGLLANVLTALLQDDVSEVQH